MGEESTEKKENPLDRPLEVDENGLYTDIQQLRYMTHTFIAAYTTLIDGPVGDAIKMLDPLLGVSVAMMALIIHKGVCDCPTKESEAKKGDTNEWERAFKQQQNLRKVFVANKEPTLN